MRMQKQWTRMQKHTCKNAMCESALHSNNSLTEALCQEFKWGIQLKWTYWNDYSSKNHQIFAEFLFCFMSFESQSKENAMW